MVISKKMWTIVQQRPLRWSDNRCGEIPLLASSVDRLFRSTAIGYEKLFDLTLPEGRCVGLRIGDISLEQEESGAKNLTFARWVYMSLHPEEVKYASKLSSEASQKSFVGGRLALRHAMECQVDDCIILKDSHGRPMLPSSFLGSVSHKGDVAVALVARATEPRNWGIGVDLEFRKKGHEKIARRILTPHENETLGLLQDVTAGEEVLLRFSLKEAVYKAMHPLICQYVGFQEAETIPLSDGSAQVLLNLTSGAHHGFESVTANWKALDDYFLTSARVRLKPGEKPRIEDITEDCRI